MGSAEDQQGTALLQTTLFHVEKDLIRKRHQNSEGRRAAGAGVSEERRAAVLQQAAAAENVEAAQQNHSPSGLKFFPANTRKKKTNREMLRILYNIH